MSRKSRDTTAADAYREGDTGEGEVEDGDTDADGDTLSGDLRFTRRQALATAGAAAAAFGGLAGCAGAQTTAEGINAIEIPAFVTDAEGNPPPFDDDTLVFDPGPVSIPLDQVVADNPFGNDLATVLNDSRQLVTKPPAGYDPESDDGASWDPVRWGELSGVAGTVDVGDVTDAGTQVTLDVEGAIPRGQYTVWVVKFAALEDPDAFDAFVTPRGNGLVGFQNLGPKCDTTSEADNAFRTDADGGATVTRRNEGGPLTGIPGFREPGYPFVGEAGDYEQDPDRLTRVADDLRAEDEIHLVGAYHYDDQTWGAYPGPWHLNHFDARFSF